MKKMEKENQAVSQDGLVTRSANWMIRQVPFLLFLSAIVFLSFIGGSFMTVARIRPSGYVRDAYRAATALYQKHTQFHDPLATDLWAPARTERGGISLHQEKKAYQGLTLYTSGHGATAQLIDMEGHIVHTWERPFSTVWDSTAAVQNPVPDNRTSFNKAHLFPNGDLLVIYIGVGDTPYGYGMARIDRESRLLWKNLDHFHHDFAVAADGRIFGLTHDLRTQSPKGVDHLELPVLDDYLAIVSAEGIMLKKISLLDALNRSEFRRLLWLVPYYSLSDPLHTNNVDLLDHRTASALQSKIPVAAMGQVLLSFRELAGGTIALLDPASEKIVWAARGQWLSQHDPDVLPNGHILLFDNRGHFGSGGESRIIEFDPENGAVVWEYAGSDGNLFQSMIRSDQQQLPNENILITESDGGRLLEVTREGEIVWEYINPVRAGKDNKRIPILNWADRIGPHYLSPDFQDELRETLMAREE